jgi:hypothetical protein
MSGAFNWINKKLGNINAQYDCENLSSMLSFYENTWRSNIYVNTTF